MTADHSTPIRRTTRAGQGSLRCTQRGSAVLIVLILLSLMAVLVMSNTVVLRRLKIELQILEEKQQRKFEAPPPDRRAADRAVNSGG